MDIKAQLNNIVDQTTKDLLEGKYQLLKCEEHANTLTDGTNELKIWHCSGLSHVKVYGDPFGFKFPEFKTDEVREKVYVLATTITLFTLDNELKLARAVALKTSNKLMEDSKAVDVILQKIEDLKQE